MINARELMIGNLLIRDGKLRAIDINDLSNINDINQLSPSNQRLDEEVSTSYEPIPISEKWLLFLGFERVHLSEFRSRYSHKETHCIGYDFPYILDMSEEGFTWYGRYVKDIKYIHQLQNIYSVLTQEELF